MTQFINSWDLHKRMRRCLEEARAFLQRSSHWVRDMMKGWVMKKVWVVVFMYMTRESAWLNRRLLSKCLRRHELRLWWFKRDRRLIQGVLICKSLTTVLNNVKLDIQWKEKANFIDGKRRWTHLIDDPSTRNERIEHLIYC